MKKRHPEMRMSGMNRTVRSRYEQLAQAAGLAMDPNSGALYGRLGEYDVIVFAPNAS